MFLPPPPRSIPFFRASSVDQVDDCRHFPLHAGERYPKPFVLEQHLDRLRSLRSRLRGLSIGRLQHRCLQWPLHAAAHAVSDGVHGSSGLRGEGQGVFFLFLPTWRAFVSWKNVELSSAGLLAVEIEGVDE